MKEVHAVDAAGVHPLLLAIGSERYTPFMPTKRPAELLTIANHILGTGQLSLAKFLFITADNTNQLTTHNVQAYLEYVFERIDLTRDVHFYTNTTMDTLDYSGTGLNSGSKVVFAAYGDKKRELCRSIPMDFQTLNNFYNPQLVMPGVIALQANPFTTYDAAHLEIKALNEQFFVSRDGEINVVQIIICDDSSFLAAKMNNYLWATYTRCNPSHDIYGLHSFNINKHWGCNGAMIIDARMKPHHAPPVEKVPEIERRVDRLFDKGGSLYGIIR